jgi:tripartite-type tricarboxylate transporter receptor subunit TctC
LIAYGKSNPAKVNLATPSKGTGPYMAAELFRMMAGIDFVVVPYRGDAPMLNDLLGGHVQVAFGGIFAALADPRIKARFADLLAPVLAGLPADFGNLIARETEKWAKVVKFAGLKQE